MPKKVGADDDDECCQTGVGRSRAGAGQEQAMSRARAGQKQEQGRSRSRCNSVNSFCRHPNSNITVDNFPFESVSAKSFGKRMTCEHSDHNLL